MNYIEALKYIENLTGLGYKLSLERMYEIMSRLDNVQDKIKVIHVAGTNGKGSSCAMLSSILITSGFSVGMYTSPHLRKYNERYMVNGTVASDEDFAKYISIIAGKCDEMTADGFEQPSVFEVLTAAAFIYFYDKKVDYLLLEVGLGGRFDATNIIQKPLLSIITQIGMDHMEYLGNTVESIAFEKGGIIKSGCPCVLYGGQSRVYKVISELCAQRDSRLYYLEESGLRLISRDLKGTHFDVENEYFCYNKVSLALIGEYQLNNALTVLTAVRALRDEGLVLEDENVLNGLKSARWDGRMQVVQTSPLILIDGAHNVDGITRLAASVKTYFIGKKLTLLIGILGDKEYEKMLELLIPLAERLVLTEPNSMRKWHIDDIKGLKALEGKRVYYEHDIKKAFELSKEVTGEDGVLCCAGSLYLVGELYKIIKG